MPPLRAIIWTAVSTKLQTGDDKISLLEQERLARAFAAENDMLVVDVLSVPGHSRAETDILTLFEDYATANIRAYHDLRQHWQANDFDVLIAFHPNRLGRSFSIQSFVLENTVKKGRRAYLIQGGWVNDANVDFIIAGSGIAAKSEIKQRVAMTAAGTERRMRAGLHTRRIAFTHRAVRDSRGRATHLEIREEHRRLFDDMASLVLTGLGWQKMGQELRRRGHLNPDTGRPISATTVWRMFHNPYTWGYSATNFTHREGIWAFDETAPLPPVCTIERRPNPPIPCVFPEALAAALKSELLRRANIVAGRSFANYHLTGLMRCAGCNSRLVICWSGNGGLRYWKCPRVKTKARHSEPCENIAWLPDSRAKAQISALLQRAAQLGIFDFRTLFVASDTPDYSAQLATLEANLTTAESRLDTLILQRADYPATIQSRVATLIAEAAARLDILRAEKSRLLALVESDVKRSERQKSLSELQSLPDLWLADPVWVNRLLNTMLGRHRFIVSNGEIVDVG